MKLKDTLHRLGDLYKESASMIYRNPLNHYTDTKVSKRHDRHNLSSSLNWRDCVYHVFLSKKKCGELHSCPHALT